jgi:hypothetical protein
MAVPKEEADQMAHQIQPRDGGFTYDTSTNRHHQGAGWAVAIPGHEERHPPGYEIARTHIQHYEEAHRNFLAQKGVHLGGWHDPKTGVRTFDTSEIFTHRELGRSAMVARGEDAMTNMTNFKSTRNKYKEAHAAGKISDADYELMRAGGVSLESRYRDQSPAGS